MHFLKILLLYTALFITPLMAESRYIMRENMSKARPGDYLVTTQSKMFTVMHIRDKNGDDLVMEEISAPLNRIPKNRYTWHQWIECGAPGNTSWMMYHLNTATGKMQESFSYTKNCWFNIPESENFLSTLLNLQFTLVPLKERKRVGPKSSTSVVGEWRNLWQPRMVVNGLVVEGVSFNAWRGRWPSDGSELAGKVIEVYIPEESDLYPSYFPYWMQISGMIGKAKVRIVDSGTGLQSPKPLMHNK